MQLSYGATSVCLKEVFVAGKASPQFCRADEMRKPSVLWLTAVKLQSLV